MFGGEVKTTDRKVVSAKPGIIPGFTAKTLFEKVTGNGDNGPWTAYDFKFEGPVTVSQRKFIPTVKPQNKWNDKDTAESVQKKYKEDVHKFNELLLMYAATYVDQGTALKLPAFADEDALIAGLDKYIDALKESLPSNYNQVDLSLIIGREEGDQWLNLPVSTKITGRFIKRTDDATRELTLSNLFKTKFMKDVSVNAGSSNGATEEAAQDAVAGTEW